MLKAWSGRANTPRAVFLLAACTLGCEKNATDSPPGVEGPPAPAVAAWDRPISRPVAGDREKSAAALAAARSRVQEVRLGEAADLYLAAVTADPSNSAAQLERGLFLARPSSEQSLGLALESLRTANLLNPDDPQGMAGEGVVRQQLGDHDGAAPLLVASLDLLEANPELCGWAHKSLGRIAHAGGDLDNAREHFDAALELAQGTTERASCHEDLATLHLEEQRFDLAEAELRKAIEAEPVRVRSHYLLVRALQGAGRGRDAAKAHRVHELLRQIDALGDGMSKRRREERIRLRRELIKVFPYPGCHREFIRDLVNAGEFYQAIQEISREQKRSGGVDSELLYLLARVRAGEGKIDEAGRHFQSIRKLDASAPPSIARGILDEWKKAYPQRVSETLYQKTLARWLSASPADQR